MNAKTLNDLFDMVVGWNIPNCNVYLSRPTIVGNKETRETSYIIVSFPNGMDDSMEPIQRATGVITIGAKDEVIGLPNSGIISEIADTIKSKFPIINDDYTIINFKESSDDSEGTGWHEYYYTFQIYINKP